MKWAALVATIGVLGVPSVASGATFLVAIGNNYGRADEPRLSYAEADATQFADVLKRLGRVSGENTILLTAEDAPTLRGVLLRINARIRHAQGDAGPDHALIVYYSGHADATGLHLGESTLRFDELKAIVESSPARVRVLIVDSCRSGGITRIKGATPAPPFTIRLEDRLEAEGTAIITSSAGTEDSQESETLGASFFTHHFVNALRGAADRDKDTRVTINEAYSYAYKETLRSTGRTMKIQHPTYLYDIKGKGDFVLTYLADGRGRAGILSIDEPGAYLIIESNRSSLVAEVAVEAEGADLLLAPGRYYVQRRAANSYREYALDLAKGGKVTLSDTDYDDVAYSRLIRKGGSNRTAIHRVQLLGAARGAVIEGHGVSPNAMLAYGADFSSFSLGIGGRWSMSTGSATGGDVVAKNHELALRVTAERFIDLSFLSLSLGLVVEGIHIRQSFESGGDTRSGSGFALGFGGLAAVEAEVTQQMVIRFEGGPMTQVYKRGVTRGGEVVGSEIVTPLTWWLGLGGAWKL